VSLAATFTLLLSLAASALDRRLLVAAAVSAAALVAANWDLYAFFAKKRGLAFAAAAVPLHGLYQVVCGIALVWGSLSYARSHA
jgi:hypothetical protein